METHKGISTAFPWCGQALRSVDMPGFLPCLILWLFSVFLFNLIPSIGTLNVSLRPHFRHSIVKGSLASSYLFWHHSSSTKRLCHGHIWHHVTLFGKFNTVAPFSHSVHATDALCSLIQVHDQWGHRTETFRWKHILSNNSLFFKAFAVGACCILTLTCLNSLFVSNKPNIFQLLSEHVAHLM